MLWMSATVPRTPYSPNKPLNLSLALAIGLMMGTGLAFFIEFLDNSVKTPDDVDRYIKLPVSGSDPCLRFHRLRQKLEDETDPSCGPRMAAMAPMAPKAHFRPESK